MLWRPSYALALILAAAPPLLAPRLAIPVAASTASPERAGLTLGEGPGRRVVVTSLMQGGPADRGGVAVGDELRDIDGRRVTGAAMARRLIRARRPCTMRVDLRRAGVRHVADIRRCA